MQVAEIFACDCNHPVNVNTQRRTLNSYHTNESQCRGYTKAIDDSCLWDSLGAYFRFLRR